MEVSKAPDSVNKIVAEQAKDLDLEIYDDSEEEMAVEWYKYNCGNEETEDWIADVVKYYSKFNSLL
jgi:hypothetical protein